MSIPYGFPFSFIFVVNSCKSAAVVAIKAVSSAYMLLLMFVPPITTPICTISRTIFSVYRLNKLADNTHPFRTPFFILNSSVNHVSVLTTAVCYQYIFVMICRSLPSIPISFRQSDILECMTLSIALV